MNKKGSITAVEPIYSAEDVRAMGAYLLEEDKQRQQPAYIIWLLCVNGGFRVGDMLKLKVYQIYGTGKKVKDYIEIREEKRGKVQKRRIAAELKKPLQEYVNGLDWKGGVKYQSYLFASSRKEGKHYRKSGYRY